MITLPLPTDSLYKFAFTFGLLLVVFSFYYKNSFLNKYDRTSTPYLLDSLNSYITVSDKGYQIDTLNIAASKARTMDEFWWERTNTFNYETIISDVKMVDSITLDIKKDRQELSLLNQALTIKNERRNYKKIWVAATNFISYRQDDFISKRNKKILERNFYKQKLIQENIEYWFLVLTGIGLFIPGMLLWYHKIQKKQDCILTLQLNEALNKIPSSKSDKSIIRFRKHFEPATLPRRNLMEKPRFS